MCEIVHRPTTISRLRCTTEFSMENCRSFYWLKRCVIVKQKRLENAKKYNYKPSVAIMPFNLIVTSSLAMGEERFEVLE